MKQDMNSLTEKLEALVAAKPFPSEALSEAQDTNSSIFGFALPRDEQIALYLMEGRSKTSIAKEMGLSKWTIYNVVKDPQFINALHKLQGFMREKYTNRKERLELLSSHALDRLANIVCNSGDDDLVLKASFGVLDRAGHSIKMKSEVAHTIHIDKEAGECIEAAFRELEVKELTHEQR